MASRDLQDLVIRPQDSLLAAMRRIDGNRREVALVLDDAGRLVGVITDGDIRRGLLQGLGTEAASERVMTTAYTSVGIDTDRAAILDLMRARSIRHVPIVDGAKRLLGIHFLQDLIAPKTLPNAAVIMAGGKGTRLHPITQSIPKPMVQVAGRPILERLVLQLVGNGIRQIYISLNYMPDVIKQHFGDGSRFGCKVEYLMESEPLGTGGSLSLLPRRPADPLLVMNGDLVMQIDFARLLDFHRDSGGVATIAVKPYEIEIPFGVVRESNGVLVGLQEKPTSIHVINAGVYAIDPMVLDFVPKEQAFPMTALFERLLKDKRKVNVFHLGTEWADIGRPEELRKARGEG